MAPTRSNWEIVRGDTNTRYWPVFDEDGNAIDSTDGWSARMEIRHPDSGTLLHSWTNADMSVGGTPATLRVETTIDADEAISWTRGVFDLEVTSPTSVVTTLYDGVVKVISDTTRSTN